MYHFAFVDDFDKGDLKRLLIHENFQLMNFKLAIFLVHV